MHCDANFTLRYERIIRRMKKHLRDTQWTVALKLLGWMVCAKRPLNWREIQAAVSIDLENQTIDFDKRKLRSNIQDYCGSLIQVLPGDRIELVHTTAKKYALSSLSQISNADIPQTHY